jgi:hypothetical protein
MAVAYLGINEIEDVSGGSWYQNIAAILGMAWGVQTVTTGLGTVFEAATATAVAPEAAPITTPTAYAGVMQILGGVWVYNAASTYLWNNKTNWGWN